MGFSPRMEMDRSSSRLSCCFLAVFFIPCKQKTRCWHYKKRFQWSACSSTTGHYQERDLYSPFLTKAIELLKTNLDSLRPYPIPPGYEEKQAITGKGSRQSLVKTTSYAYQSDKLRQIRAAHVQGGKTLQVLNFVIFPHLQYDLPFFGADLVTLPGGHLIALDMQPLFQSESYRNRYYIGTELQSIHQKYASLLPWGGDLPEEAKPFFSPCFLWSRPIEDEAVSVHVFAAFQEYLQLYLKWVHQATNVTMLHDDQYLQQIRSRHLAYIQYRAEKDPARGMFTRFYGKEWTEEYIHGKYLYTTRMDEDCIYLLGVHRILV